MLHTIKWQSNDFNLLYLIDGEYMINTMKCYTMNPVSKNM
jgi:hypothetical protein